MEGILNFLGFTSTVSTLWYLLGYTGMVLIIIAVLSDKLRDRLFVWGVSALLVFAWFFLHDPILAGLQFITTVSAVLNLLKIKKSASFIVIALAVMVFAALLITGEISGLWLWFGALGLLGIALGLAKLPRRRAFALMAIGGLLIVIYALVFKVWVFFILNIFFTGVSLIEFITYKEEAEN